MLNHTRLVVSLGVVTLLSAAAFSGGCGAAEVETAADACGDTSTADGSGHDAEIVTDVDTGLDGLDSDAADLDSWDTGTTDGQACDVADSPCPAGPQAPLGALCTTPDQTCAYGYDPIECGGRTVICADGVFVELEHTDPMPECFGDIDVDLDTDSDAGASGGGDPDDD